MDKWQESNDSPPAVPPPPRPRRFGLPAAAGILAAGLAIGTVIAGLGLGLAQTESPSPAPSSGTSPLMPGHKGFFGRGGFGGRFGFFGALHGEFTVVAPGGGYETLAVQRGQVTAVSASSITVRSAD